MFKILVETGGCNFKRCFSLSHLSYVESFLFLFLEDRDQKNSIRDFKSEFNRIVALFILTRHPDYNISTYLRVENKKTIED